MEHTAISPEKAADRLAIRELVDAYAHCADGREAEAQKALFTEDTHFLVYMNGVGTEPTEDLHGREQLTPVFAALKQYDVTMHFNGQSTIELDGERATGETQLTNLLEEMITRMTAAYQNYLDAEQSNVATFQSPSAGNKPASQRRTNH